MSNLEAAAVQHVHHTVASDSTLGLLIDFQSRVISVDETIGIHRKVADVQTQLNNLHGLFVELHDRLRPLLMMMDERDAVCAELYKEMDVLRARKEKLVEEIDELKLLL